ncbi:MAG: DNA methyltransferase [Polyangia bacterium]|jgi:site-specific DNA-methyltransferase (adenine-specific)|nr:DNA methyltransferase [Polyangia bacterium]
MEASVALVSSAAPGSPKTHQIHYSSPSGQHLLVQGDCIEVLKTLPDGSVDLIFADPPYFLSNGGVTCQAGRMVAVDKGRWDRSRGAEANHEYNRTWLAACQRVLTQDGSIFVSGTRHVIFSVGYAMQQLGFKMLNDISWHKVTPPPNLSCRYFTHATETILWAAKNERSRHLFNYALMKEENGGRQMKSLWHIQPPLKSEKRFGKHPTQKPITLLDRIIRAASRPGDLVLDPFNGSGTTGVAALLLDRSYIGIDLDPAYLALAMERLKDPEGDLLALRRTAAKEARTSAKSQQSNLQL